MNAFLASLPHRLQLAERSRRLRRGLGRTGLAALALLAGTALFAKVALEPLQARAGRATSELARQGTPAAAGATSAAGKLESFYSHLSRGETTTDWLAKLYAIGQATGVELKSGTYRAPAEGPGRIERYEIVLPVAGSYPQMRDFLNRALAEIPVLSLDHMALKRESRNDGAVQAELKLSLHRVKP